jgi:hypothetical protein
LLKFRAIVINLKLVIQNIIINQGKFLVDPETNSQTLPSALLVRSRKTKSIKIMCEQKLNSMHALPRL